MEDQISNLCEQLLAERDDAKAHALAVKLREELHKYIEQTRRKVLFFTPDKHPLPKVSNSG